MDFVLKVLGVAGAFVLVLFPLIVLHEFGHFTVAKLLRIGAPVFSIGLGPRLFGVRWRGTDYRLSAIPLGGFVRLQGDEADEHRTGAPEEFLSRPRYQRFLVYVGGPLVNVLGALCLVWLVLVAFGVDEVPTDPDAYPVVVGVEQGSEAEAAGARPGDRLTRIAGQDARNIETLMREIALRPDSELAIEIERDGIRETLTLRAGADPKYRLGDPGWVVLPETPHPALVIDVFDGPAREAGLAPGDRIVGAGGVEPVGLTDLRILLATSPGVEVPLTVERGGERVALTVVPDTRKGQGFIGVTLGSSNVVHRDVGWGAAAVESLRINVRLSQTLFLTLRALFRGDISVRAFSGPIEIGQVSRRAVSGGVRSVLWFMAFISLQLGILNLMPIPILDGGHITILGVESLLRRELSERLKERVMQAGLVFLLAFFGLVIYFDVLKTTLSS